MATSFFNSKKNNSILLEEVGCAYSKKLKIYTLKNINGLQIEILNFGGIVHSLHIPDKNGEIRDIVLGLNCYCDYLNKEYRKENPYFGAIIGRYANILKNGEFTLDDVKYNLTKNDNNHCLHGGNIGFDKVFWDSKITKQNNQLVLKLNYLSKDKEEGFPGNLNIEVTYQLTDKNEFKINYTATTDKKTIINLTNHAYFNLKGEGNGNILNHLLHINADKFTENDNELVPTGNIVNVDSTPLDFRVSKFIGKDIHKPYNQLVYGNGYDQNFCLNKKQKHGLELAACLSEPLSGRKMEVYTTATGLQLYTGNNLNKNLIGKGNKSYYYQAGLCLETQDYPDSASNPNFPSTILNPKEEYKQTTILKFSTIK